jgi:hypothetical protein
MKILLTSFLQLFMLHNGYTQSTPSLHAMQIQLEFLGPGVAGSLAVDSRFTKGENGLGFRAGIGMTPLGLLRHSCNTGTLNSFPVGINYLAGKNKHLLEVAAGSVVLFMSGTKLYCLNAEKNFFSEETTHYWFASAGYRYQRQHKKGVTYRAFISPLFQKSFPIKLWGGASIGYRF